jgi:hypothetical protein
LPKRSNGLISDILAELLDYGGIKSAAQPHLFLWRQSGNVARRVEIKTVKQFLNLFGVGTYQIYVENPEIEGVDPENFAINSLSITTTYSVEGNWSEPRIQTDEEEITPDYIKDFNRKAKDRAKRIASKAQGALTILSLMMDAYKIIRDFSGS